LDSCKFTTGREFILANSATIIQDDSGVPLTYYDPKKWRFFPFGRYLGPIGEFPSRYQQPYAELFRKAQPIDFGIGYRWRTHESNLLLSVRLPSEGPGSVETTSSAEPVQPRPAPAPRPKKPRPPPRPPGGFFWFGR